MLRRFLWSGLTIRKFSSDKTFILEYDERYTVRVVHFALLQTLDVYILFLD
jgi:hypothetical protein